MQVTGCGKGNAVISWTGGKDCCYSCFLAMAAGYHIVRLLHFRNTRKTGSHEMNPEMVQAQAGAMDIPLIQQDAYSYETEFRRIVRDLRAQGERIDAAVFGHIATHKPLVDRLCCELDLDLVLPLWNRDPEQIVTEMIDAGFEIRVVSARESLMGSNWLGRKIDQAFIEDLRELDPSIDPCGENGEFHTIVTDGPVFHRKIVVTRVAPVLREGYWFWDIREVAFREKP